MAITIDEVSEVIIKLVMRASAAEKAAEAFAKENSELKGELVMVKLQRDRLNEALEKYVVKETI